MNDKILKGLLLDEATVLSLDDLCQACSSSNEWVIELVQEGILEPQGQRQTQWQFSARCLQKAHAAMRLQRDLDINLSGIALALDLLDEIDSLKSRLLQLEQAAK
ncbi:MAG: chaperone modulator CbpM [Cycloclasticus pugetii]|nr:MULTISPECIES: chaperone modulator CbpM [Cycloclasticus]AGS40327.1 MerR family transcriptional regulator [Cycloclasticus zancles 78-ME]MDF1828635.1 chaperone modulator CbpM [Cycloclasticus pugetii]